MLVTSEIQGSRNWHLNFVEARIKIFASFLKLISTKNNFIR